MTDRRRSRQNSKGDKKMSLLHSESNYLRFFPLIFLAAWISSCANVTVNNDYDPNVDFASMEDYAWLQATPQRKESSISNSSLQAKRVRAAVEAYLASKGIRKVSRADADFLIAQHLNIEKRVRLDTYNHGYGFGQWGRPGGFHDSSTLRQYEEGTLIIDFVHPEKEELIWRGTAQSRIQRTTTPSEREALIRKTVEEILGQYPPSDA